MAEMAVSSAVNKLLPLLQDKLLPLLQEETNLLRGIHKEFADLKDELESIQAFLKDADKRAVGKGEDSNVGVKTWVKQVREAAFRIEDVIDEYMVSVAEKPRDPPHDPRSCVALLHKISHLIKPLKRRYRMASEIQDIKSSLGRINKRSKEYGFQIEPSIEQGSSSSGGQQTAKWHDPRNASLYVDKADVVGFEESRNRLIGWLVKGKAERIVVSVVGMGGQGKTTLAKKVFDSKEVIQHFDCCVWIMVSQSYTIEGLLRDMLLKLYKKKGDDPPKDIFQMDRGTLIDEVRNYLLQKRYVVVFDDVWSEHFWDDIEFAVIDNKNGSRIFITTRKMDVVISRKKSSFVEVHELQPLTKEQSLELFNKKAFRFDCDGCCPKELIGISSEIVKKCKGLPLAIVAISGLLSTKEKNAFEWQRFSENLSSGLNKDSHLIGINEILGLSYDDLPCYLKSCLLYFGIYPEGFEVRSKRLIRQWIAEGFVKEERGKTLEEVAEGYLTELIHRSLVQVSSNKTDGKAKSCRVHDLIHAMLFEKFEDLSFCKHISEDGMSSLSGRIRRLSIAAHFNDLMESTEISHVRSLLVFTKEKFPEYVMREIATKYKLLKVLDFENGQLFYAPENFGKLIHLKYLSFRYACAELPVSISMLHNLETLDVRGKKIHEMPKEVSKLRKLRHLLGYRMSLIQLKDGIGGMTSLQTLSSVNLDVDGVVELIRELGKLKQLRKLGVHGVREADGSVLSFSINEMQHLQKLEIISDEVIDLHLISSPPMLQSLTLNGKLRKLPKWIPQLQNLVKLKLMFSQITDDPMKSLKDMQNLLSLSITHHAYEGESLHFQDGWFQKLKELQIKNSDNLNSIIIEKGALHSLKKLMLCNIPQLKMVPIDIQHLEKLEDLTFGYVHIKSLLIIAWDWIIEFLKTRENLNCD